MALTRVASFNQDVYIAQESATPQKLFGVQAFDADWDLPLTPVKAAGYGLINHGVQGEIVGSVNVSRFVTESILADPLVNYSAGGGLLEDSVSGFLAYGSTELNKGFSFKDSRVTSYSSSCAIGGIATSDFSLTVYGNMLSGTGLSTVPVRAVGIVDAGGIEINLSDAEQNGVQSYDFNINLNWSPLYGLGASGQPVGFRLNYPLEISVNFEMIVDSYMSQNLTGLMCAGKIDDILITLKTGCAPPEVAAKFAIPNAELKSTSFSSTVNDNLMASLSYVAYVPKAGELSTIFPAL